MSGTERPRRPRRAVSGVLLLDKPAGMTSNAALQRVKWLFRADKAGHTGALDPLATGVLPLCFGEATKFSQYLLDADKVYRAEARLGVTTDSGDADGQVLAEHPVPALDRAAMEAVLARFHGQIDQVPSMFSALKRDGRPLYELARAGISVEREARRVRIDRLELESLTPTAFSLVAGVSKGTYIRSLVEDIGQALACGAHVTALRRLAAGGFGLDRTVTLAQVEAVAIASGEAGLDALLLPPEILLAGWPEVTLSRENAYHTRRGQPAPGAGDLPPGTRVALFEATGTTRLFLGVGEIADDGRVAPRRLVNTASGQSGN
ncbi:MAG: tRNA pseudouridine(55) synthase TruB [Pseudomonadota bacterium]